MRNLDLLIPRDDKPTERWTWATVTQSSPLRIRLDGETAALDITPENLAGILLPGERVWVQISGRRVLVTGRNGGSAGVPTGAVSMFMGDTAPPGWLLCDGSAFDGVANAALADLLGSTNTPDMRLRFPLGSDGLLALGSIGGSEVIDLSQIPAHAHSINHDHSNATTASNSHTHGFMFETWDTTVSQSGTGVLRVSDIQNASGGSGANHNVNTDSTSHSHTVDIPSYSGNSGSAGGGADYWQPHIVVNFIIKT
jgi:microcystin-dependent protein